MISQILRHVGLSDHGPDTIDSTAVADVDILVESFDLQAYPETHMSTLSKGRRYRLVTYCLRFFQEVTQLGVDEAQRNILPLACECLTILIGRNGNFPTSFSLGCTSTYSVAGNTRTCSMTENDISSDEALGALWKDQIFPLRIQDLIHEEEQDDGVKVLRTRLPRIANVVSPLLAKVLRDTSMAYIKRCVTQTSESAQIDGTDHDGGDDNDINSDGQVGKGGAHPLMTKVLITIAVADDDASSCSDNLDQIHSEICHGVGTALELLKKQSNEDFDAILIDLLGVFRALLSLSSVGCASIVRNFGEKAKDFYEECYRYLKLYAVRSDEGMITSNSPAIASQRRSATSTARMRSSDHLDTDSEDDSLVLAESDITGRTHSLADPDNDVDDSEDEYFKSRGVKRRKAENTGAIALSAQQPRNGTPHARGAWLCAAAMTVLDPSLECYKSVTDCLVWPDNLEDETIHTVDRTDALVCLSLFVKSDAVLREKIALNEEKESSMNDDETVVSICADIIQTIRSAADTPSMLHLYGFGAAAGLIQLGDSYEVSNRDINFLIDVLHPDGRKAGDKNALKLARVSVGVSVGVANGLVFALFFFLWLSRSLRWFSPHPPLQSYNPQSSIALSQETTSYQSATNAICHSRVPSRR